MNRTSRCSGWPLILFAVLILNVPACLMAQDGSEDSVVSVAREIIESAKCVA